MIVTYGLREAVARNPKKKAIICGNIRLSYLELSQRVNRLANALQSLGLSRGDRVAVLALNCHRYFELYYAIPQAGGSIVPINFRIPPSEIKYIIDHSESRIVFVDAAHQSVLQEIGRDLKSVEHIVLMDTSEHEGCLAQEELIETASAEFARSPAEESEVAGIFYTSGTTGEPKGVMLSHANIVANANHSNAVFQYEPDTIYLHAAPMFHLADAGAIFSNTIRGATHVFIPRFDPKAVLEIVSREQVTSLLLVPTMLNFVLQHPERESYDLSSVRQITYGASPIAPDLLRRAIEAFGCRFVQGYGLTEASPLLTVLLPEDHVITNEKDVRRLASCGKPVPGVDVRVVKESGEDVTPGEVGEIIARGPNIMAGYWKRPDDTRAAIRDEWLYTGDLATVDEEGYIYLVDRKKDMIVTGGENVFSTEVEALIYEHPAIKEAAVIPIPDENWGEAVHACITLREGEMLTADELIEFCRGKLAGYKVPRSVEILEGELPKGGTGKILKKELRERHWGGRDRRIN